MQLTMRPAFVPRPLTYLAVVALLLVAAAVAVVAIGARPRVVPPFGLAANGLVAFERNGAIVVAQPDGTSATEIVTGVDDARGPVFAPDGSRLVFYGTVDGAPTIMAATSEGREVVTISTGIELDDLSLETRPSWSPDSRQLVFSGLVGDQRQLFIAAADGSGARPVGDAALSRIDPMWSPDGQWIAFHGFRPEDDARAGQYRTAAGLYLIRPDGREETLLVEAEGGDFIFRKPQWLPNPEAAVLAYSVGEPSRYDIALFDVAVRQETVISTDPAAELWPVWSPDGSTLAWGGSDGRIRFAGPDGELIRAVPGAVDYEFVWSPDGQYLLGFSTTGKLLAARADGPMETVEIAADTANSSHWSWQRQAP